jgi:hypothetical protein
MKLFIFISLIVSSFAMSRSPEGLEVIEEYTLPTVEISGMAWRKDPTTSKRELVLVSDREYSLYIVDWENRKPRFQFRKVDLTNLKSEEDGEQSEWESVFSDESGRVYIVKEEPGRILVLSPDLSRVEKRISIPRQSRAENSGAEGLFPLNNGHFIVVNEKEPLRIVELGARGEKPSGYTSSLNIENSGNFPVEKIGASLASLKTWAPDSETLRNLKDSSGINADFDGNLYLLSDEEKVIALIGDSLTDSQTEVSATKYWKLPKKLKNPEGMVIDSNKQPIIAIDNKDDDKPNLFLLSPLQ